MYNPWGAHSHGHHAHAHAHSATTTPALPSGTPVSLPASSRINLDSPSHNGSPSQSSYQMSQMRWLPSMMTTRSPHGHSSLPTISSGLRLQHPHPGQGHAQAQAQGSVMVESRAGPQTQTQTQQVPGVESVESEESDRSESPGETTSGTRDAGGADALGEPEFGGEGAVGRNGEGEGVGDGLGESINGAAGKELSAGSSLTPRKHGKRLTTKEEVSLFEICNRHAADFGRRSNLCKWWMTVTMEFTRGQKHPYSWHSVRRKVELVTKQRMKFLEEQRDKGGTEAEDLSNPRWRAVVDAWIPTWQRWEEAEAARIEKRDSRRPRKRKWTVATPTSTTITADGSWDLPASAPSTGPEAWRAASNSSGSPMVSQAAATTPLSVSSTPVRLPPGFDTMFSSQQRQPQGTPPSSTPFKSTSQHLPRYNQTPTTSTPQNANVNSASGSDSTMMAAVLETLGKLNKHLESNSNSNANQPSQQDLEPSPSQAMSQDVNAGNELQNISSGTLSNLKEELKREMLLDLRAEWDKERAALEEKLDSVQRTQEMILEMLRQEPS
ncbi:hypothetical protein BJX61DRAFT_153127 [Aspergillus egyptiacus]|nr:hypothetical protein BJX61DRAFT_153127 [Aspergillus egyptiacus]